MMRTVIGLLVIAALAVGNISMAEGSSQVDTGTDIQAPGATAAPQSPFSQRLTWAPPAGWENYEPAYLSASGGYLELDPQKDYRIVAPDVVEGLVSIRGGRNVVWIGGHIRIANAGPSDVGTQRRGLVISDSPSAPSVEGRIVHLEGLLFDGDDLAEGINTNAPAAIIQIQNVHVAGVRIRGADDRDGTGIYERGNHSDVVQIWGSQHELRIDGLTGSSNYQGFFLEETADDRKRNPLRLRRINLKAISEVGEDGYTYAGHRMYRWLPEDVGQQFIDNGTVWMQHHPEGGWAGGYSYKVAYRNASGVLVPDPPPGNAEFRDTVAPMFPLVGTDAIGTYAYWPTSETVTVNGQPGVVSWDGSSPGRIYSGTPPGGDYVPASSVGLGYVSPGYLDSDPVDPGPGPGDDGSRFIDVTGHVHEQSIEAIADAGITLGCNPPMNDRFCPSDRVTRAQMAAFLVRALGLTNEGGGDHFTDDDGMIFESSIDRLATAGVTKGCNPPTNDRYCPNSYVTRAEMAAFLVRAFGYSDAGAGDLFIDDDGMIFESSIDRLATAGVTKGCNPPTNDRYCPNSYVTRAEMAAFLNRALGLS